MKCDCALGLFNCTETTRCLHIPMFPTGYKEKQLEQVSFDQKLKEVWDAAREGTHNDGTMIPFGQGYKYKTFEDYTKTNP